MPRFEHKTLIGASADDVFEFIRLPPNLEELSPPDAALKFIEPPERLEAGTEFSFEVTAFGQVQRVRHEVTEVKEFSLTQKQIKGPMKSWEHTSLVETIDNACRLKDVIEFEPPSGLLGLLLKEERIRSRLEESFTFRSKRLIEIFGAAE